MLRTCSSTDSRSMTVTLGNRRDDLEHHVAVRRVGRSDERRGIVGERGRIQHEHEVRRQRVPLDAPHARELGRQRQAADLERQLVAELEAEPLHDAFFDRDLGALGAGRPPLAGDDLVRRVELLGPRQVRLAHQPAAFAAHAAAHDVLAVDRGEPGAHHRHELGRLLAALGEQRANAVGFLALDVDHEMVRRIGRQATRTTCRAGWSARPTEAAAP